MKFAKHFVILLIALLLVGLAGVVMATDEPPVETATFETNTPRPEATEIQATEELTSEPTTEVIVLPPVETPAPPVSTPDPSSGDDAVYDKVITALFGVIGVMATLLGYMGIKSSTNVPLKAALSFGLLLAQMTPKPDDNDLIKSVAAGFGITSLNGEATAKLLPKSTSPIPAVNIAEAEWEMDLINSVRGNREQWQRFFKAAKDADINPPDIPNL